MKITYYLKKYKKECILAPLFKMIEACFDLTVPLVVKDIINVGIPNNDFNYILLRFGFLIGLAILGYSIALVAQYFSAKAATGFGKEIKEALFSHIETLSYEDLDQVGTSTLISRMSSDVNQIQQAINRFLRLVLRSPFVVIGALIMAFTVSPKLAVIFALAVPLLGLLIYINTIITIPMFRKVQAKLDVLMKKSRENITGTRVIRAFGGEEIEVSSFESSNEDYTKFQIFAGKISGLINPFTYVIINISIVCILYFGAKEVFNGNLLNGDIIAEYNYMTQILVELLKFANVIVLVTRGFACKKRIASIFDIKPSQKFVDESKIDSKNNIAVVFDHVSLCYKNNQQASLENISFILKENETLGVIGGTGSGKSSLISLVPRFYDSTSGKITIFGNDINLYSKNDLRKAVGVVSQKAVLFSGTIRENLSMSNPGSYSDEELLEALKVAQGLDIITSKENGLDEYLNQGGKNLSGGQRQRLSIARTIVSKPDILILDDSSSALDYLTDYKLRTALKELKQTMIITAQRASSVMDCDHILVLDEGKCVGYGTHKELLASCKVYQEIYYSQFEKEGE